MSEIESRIKAIVGLGNPGQEYERTRHNAGFVFVDRLLEKLSPETNWNEKKRIHSVEASVSNLKLFKPTTFMNLSGSAVQAILDYYKLQLDQVMVVHDDMDLDIGQYKFQFAKGPKKHNGIDSIVKMSKSEDFWRLRLGIENREVKGNQGTPGQKYALQRFTEEEKLLLDTSIDSAISDLGV